MTVAELTKKLDLTVFHDSGADREVTGGYVGDLLSWVMGRAEPGQAWLTIMSNQNVAAVAALSDVSCVILTEGVQPDEELLKKARTQGIDLLGTSVSSFAAAAALSQVL